MIGDSYPVNCCRNVSLPSRIDTMMLRYLLVPDCSTSYFSSGWVFNFVTISYKLMLLVKSIVTVILRIIPITCPIIGAQKKDAGSGSFWVGDYGFAFILSLL